MNKEILRGVLDSFRQDAEYVRRVIEKAVARDYALLEIQAELDANSYETGIEVTDEELAAVRITRDEFHGEWNYTISPRR